MNVFHDTRFRYKTLKSQESIIFVKELSNNAANLRMRMDEQKSQQSGFSHSLVNLTKEFNEQQLLIVNLINETTRLRAEQINHQNLNCSKCQFWIISRFEFELR